ncbi:MAG: hypothetical protein GXY42_11610 [Desulfovibrionales bacterium]|nr:hypothetical protein [Desulfovibrionales bacterium]
MIRAERVWRLQRVSGLASMIFLTLALLTLFDGLRTGIFGTSGTIRLIPGERYPLSGPMPPKTELIEDFVIEGDVDDGSVRLVPESIFTGYWFGGGMWRGHIEVGTQPRPGTYLLRVRDKHGEKQNPALVFGVHVFTSAADRQANSPSVVYRWSGINAYLVAIGMGILGILAAGANFLLGRQWSSILAEIGCGEIFRLKIVDGFLEAGIEVTEGVEARVGAVYLFTHPRRGNLGQGKVIACGRGEITLQTSVDAPVRLGDIACPGQI